ncbi:hypothetical protein Kpol_1031p68 [Vanderwaltozyma polyspora DSM 70294]|uniref:Gluconokinase n=1 Tax=Vanderwaltozyma polyspora (strain ATCC 22028 / DSM 70294 / BCRC 21397 / CBS 2163 / NBRC 10782 / NRRL Y-8283 / UCD 57-17) TaxID=436907 RepID=A7THZ9_VANPO|nr:uncharacterized protein Kpol_1031p68 [Vanderwaltozyma polyspora DSM 70294]EDO18161.1 hypothetical protein Kpol_1031p68 [Vanderwaltozyma polyspora DSM 70294]
MAIKVVVLGGTAGTGKTSIAEVLYENLKHTKDYSGVEYIEGDHLHPKSNVEKMAHGIPLQDEDRWGWLEQVSKTSTEAAKKHKGLCVITCSSLKKSYRDYIRTTCPETHFYFVILYGSKEEILNRLENRKGHFMKANMMDSQFADLELPKPDEPGCHIEYLDGKSYEEINRDTLDTVCDLLQIDST